MSLAFRRRLREPETARRLLAEYEAADTAIDVALPDYENPAQPLAEIFTLDSDS